MTAARQTRQVSEKRLGRYRLIESIAAGGMGNVHLALADNSKEPVAVKLLHAHLAQEDRFVAMFFEEARLAATIFHRNVVEVFDVDQINEEYLIAMRYVEGGALSRIVSSLGSKKKIEPKVVLRIVHDILLGLHAAHEATNERGEPLAIVHRDVSPQNVLVDFDGFAQVTDFGVARARGGLVTTHGDTIKGKLRYLAPEQLERSKLDRRADIFSAGIVLWELLRGEPLFAAESDAQTMRNVLDLPITPPGAPTLRLDEVCLKALERDPNRRFGTTQEFARALETAARGKLASREEVAKLARQAFEAEVSRLRSALAGARGPFESDPMDQATIPGRAPDMDSTAQIAAVPPDDAPTLLNDDIERDLAALEHATLTADAQVFAGAQLDGTTAATVMAPLVAPSKPTFDSPMDLPPASRQRPMNTPRAGFRAAAAPPMNVGPNVTRSRSRAAIFAMAGIASAMGAIAIAFALGPGGAPNESQPTPAAVTTIQPTPGSVVTTASMSPTATAPATTTAAAMTTAEPTETATSPPTPALTTSESHATRPPTTTSPATKKPPARPHSPPAPAPQPSSNKPFIPPRP